MSHLRARVANGSLMGAVSVLAWLGSAWFIGMNSVDIYGGPAASQSGAIARGATWLSVPVLLGALPAWFLARAGIRRGLGPQHGRMTRWMIGAWIINGVALLGLWLLLWWHSSAPPESPDVDLPVLILGMWCTAFTAYVPAMIAVQARRREAVESHELDTAEKVPDDN